MIKRALTKPERRAAVIYLHFRGKSQAKIAEAIGCTVGTVARDIHEQLREWREKKVEHTHFLVQQELARIQAIEHEAWAAWDRSQEDAVTVTKEDAEAGVKGGIGDRTKTRVQKTGQVGDAAFLRIVQQCGKDRRDLLGLDAPKRTEITGRDGGPIGLAREFTDDELARIAARGRIENDTAEGGGGAAEEEAGPW